MVFTLFGASGGRTTSIGRPLRRAFATCLHLAAMCLTAPGSAAAAQDLVPALQARPAALPPTLDGILNDEVWSAPPLLEGPWISFQPLQGERAPEITQVWVGYDSKAIYLAFRCLDSQSADIRATVSRRDADTMANDDYVVVSLDSSGAGQVAYHMYANALGIQRDALITGVNQEDFAADWVWQSAGRVDTSGYVVEMRVPLQSIRFRGGNSVQMRMLFIRRSSRLSVAWSAPEMPPGSGVFESQVPIVFQELRQPRLLETIPTVTASRNQTRLAERTWSNPRSSGELGGSIKYGLTSTITVDGTVNPDFSQVESDAFEVEVNQRFPIFFTEKRPFFMEGLGLLNLAGTSGNATMRTAVHTRHIIEPSAGVKLTGSAGRQTFALLSTADESIAGDSPRFFTIGRGVRNFGDGQYAGVLATSAERGREHNRVIGGDLALRRGESFRWNGSLLFADSQSLAGDIRSGVGSQLSYSYNSRRFTIAGQGEHYGRDFEMVSAFIDRVGITRVWQHLEMQFYPSYPWLRRVAPFVFVSGGNDRGQDGTEYNVQPAIVFNFTRQGFLFIGAARGREAFAGRQFRTGTGNAIVSGNAQLTKWLNIGGLFQEGPAVFYDSIDPFQGNRRIMSGRVNLQPHPKLANNLSYTFTSFERRSTNEKVFDAHIVNFRNTYQMTPELFVRAIGQLDTSRRRILTDFLVSYMPGTVIYTGYGSLLGKEEAEPYRQTARAFFFKASYLARF